MVKVDFLTCRRYFFLVGELGDGRNLCGVNMIFKRRCKTEALRSFSGYMALCWCHIEHKDGVKTPSLRSCMDYIHFVPPRASRPLQGQSARPYRALKGDMVTLRKGRQGEPTGRSNGSRSAKG